jgi:hypothetical protein
MAYTNLWVCVLDAVLSIVVVMVVPLRCAPLARLPCVFGWLVRRLIFVPSGSPFAHEFVNLSAGNTTSRPLASRPTICCGSAPSDLHDRRFVLSCRPGVRPSVFACAFATMFVFGTSLRFVVSSGTDWRFAHPLRPSCGFILSVLFLCLSADGARTPLSNAILCIAINYVIFPDTLLCCDRVAWLLISAVLVNFCLSTGLLVPKAQLIRRGMGLKETDEQENVTVRCSSMLAAVTTRPCSFSSRTALLFALCLFY